MAKAIRGAVATCCERVGFIFPCPKVFSLQKASIQNPAFRHPIKVATIRLQWNPKPKMILFAKFFLASSFMISLRLKPRL